MKRGIVKFFNKSKGFGFIKVEDTDEEIFFHVSGIIEEVQDNDEVVFEITEGRRGMNAINVKHA